MNISLVAAPSECPAKTVLAVRGRPASYRAFLASRMPGKDMTGAGVSFGNSGREIICLDYYFSICSFNF